MRLTARSVRTHIAVRRHTTPRGVDGWLSRVHRIAVAALRIVGGVTACAIIVTSHQLRVTLRAANAGEHALRAAAASLRAGDPFAAQRSARRAEHAFAQASGALLVVRPLAGAKADAPVVGAQLVAIDALADAGELAAQAASRVAAAGTHVTGANPTGGPIAALRRVRRVVRRSLASLAAADARLRGLRDSWLAPPIARAVTRTRRQLRRASAHGSAALQAAGALVTLTGGDGPRRYLFLSQNPAEVRPTGGFIGTYGVVTARDGHVHLERYDSIESWYFARRHAVVAPEHAPLALRLGRRPISQTIANANARGDWPIAARLAGRLWRKGGGAPIDGVLSITPELVARLLRVLGPVRVPGYARPATSANVVALLDAHTHTGARARAVDRQPFGSLQAARERKRFVGLLARRIMGRMTAGRVPQLALARALAAGLRAREGMAWMAEPRVQRVLAAQGWDGAIPRTRGDFFFDGEFQYAVKVGRGLRRTFEHEVALRSDRSARVTTTITVANTRADGLSSFSYLTLYGPAGGRLHPSSDPPAGVEPPIAGHPAAGWLRETPAWGRTRVRVVWDVPRMLVARRDGRLVYRLRWMSVAAHRGDVLRLRVTPPPGWTWARRGPQRNRRLTGDVRGAWLLER